MNNLIFARHINLALKGFKNSTQISLRCYSIGSNNICRKASSTTCFGTIAKYNLGISNCFSHRTSFKTLRNFSVQSVQNVLGANNEQVKRKEPHGGTWVMERIVGVILLALIPACYFEPTLPMDTALVFFSSVHVFWGLEAIVQDYVRPAVFGNLIPKFNLYYVFIPVTLLLYVLLSNAIDGDGIIQIVKRLWNLKTKEELKNFGATGVEQ